MNPEQLKIAQETVTDLRNAANKLEQNLKRNCPCCNYPECGHKHTQSPVISDDKKPSTTAVLLNEGTE